MFALLLGGACSGRRRALELYPELARYSGREIEKVSFQGAAPFGRDTLLALIETKPSHCSLLGLPICVPFTSVGRRIYRFGLDRVHQDVVRLQMFYRYSGFFGTTVKPDVEEEDDKKVKVTFKIERGDSIMLRKFTVTGTAGILDPDSLEQKLPLHEGKIFHLGQFNRSAEQILVGLQARGHAYAQVLRNFTVDTLKDLAEASLTAVPGPRVVVDSIIVTGAEHLGRRGALRQLTFRKGDLLRSTRFIESQRNLYSLELVQLATVTLAPDSLDATPKDRARATVLVSIVEAKVHQVDAAVGWGSIECFRTEAQYVNRSFTGGARRLAVTGSLSKIGLGGSTNVGLGNSICRAFDADTFENSLDYRLAVDFTQPYFLSPRNHLSLTAFVERESEPRIFQREAQGGGVVITRRLAPRFLLTGGVDIEHGKTIASPAVFCTAFEVCEPQTIEQLTHPRWRNTFGINASRDRTDVPLDPTTGSIVRSGFAWATPALDSDVTFLRWTAEGSLYRKLKPAWVAAFSLRVGTFFNTATLDPADDNDFLPPEERFYAGGAYSVRGYGRNELGPGVYVTDSVEVEPGTGLTVPARGSRFVPLGGTAMGIANAELRFPSPIYPRRFRMAAFVDAGALGTGKFLEMGGWRFTPGLGLRIQTPVGPARVDVAYNPYPNVVGPLYLELDDALVRVRDEFRPDRGGFFSRFRIHLAVGQAF